VASGTNDHRPDVDADRLVEWVNLPDWARSQAFLRAHADLIGDAGIAELYRQATRQPRAVQVLMLDAHAWLLNL